MRKSRISLLTFIFVLVIELSISLADNFDVTLFKTEMTILQGGTNSTNVRFQNLQNKTLVFVTLKFEKPAKMQISTSPIEYTDLWAYSYAEFYIKIFANESLENGTYEVKFWLDSGSGDKSNKYSFNVTVAKNPLLVNVTTTTVVQTTTLTTSANGTTTIQPGSSGLTTTVSAGGNITETTVDSDKPKYKKEYLIFLIIIVIGLFIIPYSTFRR